MTNHKIQQRNIDESMLKNFLEHWPIENLHKMTLRDYNHIRDPNTFCQEVEIKTRPLGSIRGNSSAKFGIYRQLNTSSRPRGSISNQLYTWEEKFNSDDLNENKVFETVIEEIQKIANLAMAGDFEAIENLRINPLFRWKVAYLYSQDRLIPIFAKNKLVDIANQQGMNANNYTPYYEIQKYLISIKPFDMTVVEFMRSLFAAYRGEPQLPTAKPEIKRRGRIGVKIKKGGKQERNGHKGYTANLFHDDIQQALYEQLCLEHTDDCVFMENDWVDILVELPDKVILYEIKSDRYAYNCIVKGLGQAISYAYRVQELYKKKIELIIAGPNHQTESEIDVIEFIKSQIVLPISYLKIDYQPL